MKIDQLQEGRSYKAEFLKAIEGIEDVSALKSKGDLRSLLFRNDAIRRGLDTSRTQAEQMADEGGRLINLFTKLLDLEYYTFIYILLPSLGDMDKPEYQIYLNEDLEFWKLRFSRLLRIEIMLIDKILGRSVGKFRDALLGVIEVKRKAEESKKSGEGKKGGEIKTVKTEIGEVKIIESEIKEEAKEILKIIRGVQLGTLERYAGVVCNPLTSASTFMAFIVSGKADREIKYVLSTAVKNLKEARNILNISSLLTSEELERKAAQFNEWMTMLENKKYIPENYFEYAKKNFREVYKEEGFKVNKNFEDQMDKKIVALYKKKAKTPKQIKERLDAVRIKKTRMEAVRRWVRIYYQTYLCNYMQIVIKAYALIKEIEKEISEAGAMVK